MRRVSKPQQVSIARVYSFDHGSSKSDDYGVTGDGPAIGISKALSEASGAGNSISNGTSPEWPVALFGLTEPPQTRPPQFSKLLLKAIA